LSISIEARKIKGQEYNLFWGMLHTYPLMYIAADEHDTVFVRANIDKDDLYMYPVKLQDPRHAKLLLIDMLDKMNSLASRPEWYNTVTANCTSQIAWHINKLFPGRLPRIAWQTQLSGYADALALKQGLLDTNLPLDKARVDMHGIPSSKETIHARKTAILALPTNVVPQSRRFASQFRQISSSSQGTASRT